MVRMASLLVLLLCLATPALAQWTPPFVMDDPEARRIAAGATQEAKILGPYCAMVTIFSTRETGGWRLYVGLVDDIYDRNSRVRMWRGPRAGTWSGLSPVPGYVPQVSAPNPARYRVTRGVQFADGRRYTSLMEIDLESNPPRVHLVGGATSVPDIPDFSPLEEITPLSESMRMLPRLTKAKYFVRGGMRLSAYDILLGDIDPGPKRPPETQEWQSTMSSFLLLVSPETRPEKAVAYFLPMRADGWQLRRQLPASPRYHDRFILEMFAGYLYPGEQGGLVRYYSRNRVTAGMDGMSVTTLDTGYLYEVGSERFEKDRSAATPKKTR